MAVIGPIYQSATFAWKDLSNVPYTDYTRCANPNRSILEEVIASLENGKHCTCFSSGMAAIMATLSLVRNGDHILCASDIYGGTHRMVEKMLPNQGITASAYDSTCPESLIEQVGHNTKLLIFEGPTNPTLRVCNIAKTAQIARERGILTVFDNTFASPALQNPLDHGVDIVVHSTTKYISGHSDVVGGAVVTNNDKIASDIFEFAKMVGAAPSPFDCWLSLRGLKTLPIRMKQHCVNAQGVAEFLAKHPKVSKVHYPGLTEHPDHELAKKQMRGFGGMVSFELADEAQARRVAESTEIFLLAESLGGVESLIAYPPLMSHAVMSEKQRLERGVVPTMLRLSVGIEDLDDLIEDLDQALSSA